MLSLLQQTDSSVQKLVCDVKNAVTLRAVILAALRLALLIAVTVVEEVLTYRGKNIDEHPVCPQCGARLHSKGLLPRSVLSIIGFIQWSRRVFRCPKKCKLGQVAPLDTQLDLKANQRVSTELRQAACVLVVFVPFGIATSLLQTLIGIEVSTSAIWNWVQSAGKAAMIKLENELKSFEEENVLPANDGINSKDAERPLAIGADGVMVPFRPNGGDPNGKTVWKETKIGIIARLGKRVTKKGKEVSVIVRRRLVAVLGTIDDLKPRLWLASLQEGILQSKTVVWLSDGGRGFWRIFHELFSKHAQGILDFYHVAQNVWKVTKGWLDGRTQKAKNWFAKARRRLKQGKAQGLIDEMKDVLASEKKLSDSTWKSMENLVIYLETHQDHIDYKKYKELGLPIGSGIVESTCKWLIQQRFKCVGMRWSQDGFNKLLHLRLAWVNGTYDQLFE